MRSFTEIDWSLLETIQTIFDVVDNILSILENKELVSDFQLIKIHF